jgi:Tol biopolymer transport system component
VALLIAAGFGISEFMRSRSRLPVPFQPMQVRQFTTSSRSLRAAISPDGKYVVYAQSDAGKQSLFVRQVTTSNDVLIVQPASVIYRGLTFSPDGNYVYYVMQEQNNPIQVLYQVPALGGVPRKILVNIDSPIAISPDSSRFVFVRRYRGKGEDALIIANIDGGNERPLASRKGADFFGVSGAAWSPDGKIIACPAGTNTGGRQMYVAEIRVESGVEKPISTRRWSNLGRVSWISNGRGLIISATEQGSNLAQVWYIPYPKGEAIRITNDLNDYRDMSLTEDSTALVTIQFESHVNIWLIPDSDSNRAKQITEGIGQYNGVQGLTWTPDGRLVYVSRASGSQDIWIMDQNGKKNTQLTTPETRAERYPAVSPDGRYIVFVSNRTGNSNLYRYDLQTGDQFQLTKGTSEEFPVITADSKWVIYTATGSSNFTLWKVSIDGGAPTPLTDKLSQWPDVSPDGQKIACWYRVEPNARWQIAVISISGGAPEHMFDVPPTAETPIPIRWMPDGKGISFADTRDGVSNIWNQPIDGASPSRLTNFTTDQIFWFEWSRDGKQLACSRGMVTSDVVLISEFK